MGWNRWTRRSVDSLTKKRFANIQTPYERTDNLSNLLKQSAPVILSCTGSTSMTRLPMVTNHRRWLTIKAKHSWQQSRLWQQRAMEFMGKHQNWWPPAGGTVRKPTNDKCTSKVYEHINLGKLQQTSNPEETESEGKDQWPWIPSRVAFDARCTVHTAS